MGTSVIVRSRPPRDPIDLITSWLEAINGRDAEAALALSHDELVLRPLIVLAPGLWLGHQGLRLMMAGLEEREAALRPEDRNRMELTRVEGLDDGRFMSLMLLYPTETECIGLYEVKDDRLLSVHHSFSDPEMLARVGAISDSALAR